MSTEQAPMSTVTVPVGLGGKTVPYIADPAPTILVELGEIRAQIEQARAEAISQATEDAATAQFEETEAQARALLAEARAEADRAILDAHSTADGLIAEAEEFVARRREELAAEAAAFDMRDQALAGREDALNERDQAQDERELALDAKSAHLDDRLAAVDAEATEAARVLAAASHDAEVLLREVRDAADAILDEARFEAARQAAARVEDDQRSNEEPTDRLAELENVHRIETQILHDREAELRHTIADLQERVRRAESLAITSAETAAMPDALEQETDGAATEDLAPPRHLRRPVEAHQNGHENHRFEESREQEGGGPNGLRLAPHAPLTEQLSTTAFRSVPDKKARRRR